MRAPTEKQYNWLLRLGSGAALVVGAKRETEPFIRRGWAIAEGGWCQEHRGGHYVFVRITPDGLRALAVGVERYGLPVIGNKVAAERNAKAAA